MLSLQTHAMLLLDHVPSDGSIWNGEVVEHISELWNDPIVRKFWLENCGPLNFQGGESYFFENVKRFLPDDYVPSDQDFIVFPSPPCSGIWEQTFKIRGNDVKYGSRFGWYLFVVVVVF